MATRSLLRVDRESICWLSINRPRRLNALDLETIELLQAVLDDIARREDIAVAILTGEGGYAFCAGADVFQHASTASGLADVVVRNHLDQGRRLVSSVRHLPKPVVAAVNGMACGIGRDLIEAASCAVASDRAQFAWASAGAVFGAAPDPISATDALGMGLVGRVVPHARVAACAWAIARRLAADAVVNLCPMGADG